MNEIKVKIEDPAFVKYPMSRVERIEHRHQQRIMRIKVTNTLLDQKLESQISHLTRYCIYLFACSLPSLGGYVFGCIHLFVLVITLIAINRSLYGYGLTKGRIDNFFSYSYSGFKKNLEFSKVPLFVMLIGCSICLVFILYSNCQNIDQNIFY